MIKNRIVVLAFFVILSSCIAGCTTAPATSVAGPDMNIPVFSADDPKVGTAGFVRHTLRIDKQHDGTTYTLMAFIVDDTLTLGAMVKGAFRGNVVWRVGDRVATFAFDTDAPLNEVPVAVRGDESGEALVGQGASFRGRSWVNVDVPVAAWGGNGTAVQLKFERAAGGAVTLPGAGKHYVVRLVSGLAG